MRDLITGGNIPLVLVIDADPAVRLRIRQVIEQAGLKTADAADGARGLALFKETAPDLVILDLLLPDCSGLEVCRQIRSLPQGQQVQVLITTGLDDAESIEAAYAAGATDFLTKPINWQLFEHRVRYIMRSGRNLVALNKAGEVLRESEERFRLMFQGHDAVMLLIEPETGRIVDVNPAAETFYGYPAEAMRSMTIQQINALPPDQITSGRAQAAGKKQNHFVFPHRLASGEVRTVEVYSSPIPLRKQQLLFSVIHDITDRIRTEQQLSDAYSFNEQMLTASPVGIATYDAEGQCTSMNNKGASLIGSTREQALLQNFRRLESWKDSGLLEYAEQALQTGEQTHCIIHHTTTFDRTLWMDCLFSTFSVRGGRHLLVIFSDVTRHIEAETQLNTLLAEKQIILENIAVGIGYFVNRTIVWANHALDRMFGYEPGELNGKDTLVFYPDPESYQRTGQTAYAVVNKGEIYTTELQMKRQDNSLIWCNIVGQAVNRQHPEEGSIWMLLDVSGRKKAEEALGESYHRLQTLVDSIDAVVYVADLETHELLLMNKFAVAMFGEGLGRKCWEVLQKGQEGPCPFCTNHKLLNADGTPRDTYIWEVQNTSNGRWYECRDKVIRWVDNRLVRMEIATDITEKKAIRQELAKIEKLESVGILAGGIAHDFNNLLQGILGNITIAKLQGISAEQRLQWLNSAEKACEMAHELTQRLIVFSEGGDPIKCPVRLDVLLRDAVGLAVAGSAVLAEFAFPEATPLIDLDPGQLRQVFRNLALNAREAMPSGGGLLITVRYITVGNQDTLALPSGPYAEILFRDTGPGISAEALGKIFDPYYSTKDRGSEKGTGLGLTISEAIVRKHGGRITVESEPGRGTTFHIYLPAGGGTAGE